MKKLIFLAAIAATLVACGNSDKSSTAANEVDSTAILRQQLADQDQMLASISEIEQRLSAITEAEGRIRQLRETGEDLNTQQTINEEIEFIERTLAENRQRIAELQQQLEQSANASAQLRSKVNQLTTQLEQRDKEIRELRQQVEAQQGRISELDESVTALQDENSRIREENEQVRAENESTTAIARNQDAQLNTAYYIYGTTAELKRAHVISSGEVLTNGEFNTDDFIKIDIRNVTTIPLDSKYARLLTSHPEGSYSLLKDAHGLYTLHITDARTFWSVSKYLVIRVK